MAGEDTLRLPARAWCYIGGIALAALALWAWWWHAWATPLPPAPGLVLLFFGLAVLAQHFPLTLGPKFKTNASIAVYFAALLTCGAPLGMGIAFAGQLVGGLTLSLFRRDKQTGKRTRGMPSVWFNATQIPLAVGLASLVYYSMLPQVAPARFTDARDLIALPLSGATQYLVNSGAVALMVALQQRRNPLTVWLRGRAAAARTATGLLLVGIGTAIMARDYPWSPLLLVPVAAVLQFALQWALERLDDRRAMHELAQQREHEARTALVSPAATDRELVEALGVQNPHALAGLYDRYGAEAYGLALSVLGDIAAAENVVLTVFLSVWGTMAEGAPIPDTPHQWLLDLVRQEAVARRPIPVAFTATPQTAVAAPP